MRHVTSDVSIPNRQGARAANRKGAEILGYGLGVKEMNPVQRWDELQRSSMGLEGDVRRDKRSGRRPERIECIIQNLAHLEHRFRRQDDDIIATAPVAVRPYEQRRVDSIPALDGDVVVEIGGINRLL